MAGQTRINTIMKSSEFIVEYKIRKVTRERVDGSKEVKWEVLNDNGVTVKILSDKKSAVEWAKWNL